MVESATPRATVRALAAPGHKAAPVATRHATTTRRLAADERRKRMCGRSPSGFMTRTYQPAAGASTGRLPGRQGLANDDNRAAARHPRAHFEHVGVVQANAAVADGPPDAGAVVGAVDGQRAPRGQPGLKPAEAHGEHAVEPVGGRWPNLLVDEEETGRCRVGRGAHGHGKPARELVVEVHAQPSLRDVYHDPRRGRIGAYAGRAHPAACLLYTSDAADE